MYVKTIHAVRGPERNDLYRVPAELSYGNWFVYDEEGIGAETLERACWSDLLGIEANAYIHVAIDDKPLGYSRSDIDDGEPVEAIVIEPDGAPLADGDPAVPDPDPRPKGRPYWVVRWAWWFVPEGQRHIGSHSIEAVVTTGQMFIMGDNGDTIERVK